MADYEHKASKEITSSLVQSFICQEVDFNQDPTAANPSIKDIKKREKEQQESDL